jgi:carbonic anhydrase/acetyltransferase-like protein (isoleucine patch superfamily)
MIYSLENRAPVLDGQSNYIAPGAQVIGNVVLKSHSSVWFNAVIRGDNECIELGKRSNVQDGSVLHTDPGFPLTIGDNVTVGHKVMLHGCTIGNNSLIGIGSTILNGAVVGENCIVGAHALLTENKSFPAGSLIIGAPARVVRELTADEIASIAEAADHYVDNAARFREQLDQID